MSSNCNSGGSSCPEPCAVTINVTTVEWDGTAASFQTAIFSRGAGTVTEDSSGSGNWVIISLPSAVGIPESVQLHRNSGAQRYGVDFIVSGSQIYLTQSAGASDIFQVYWFSSSATATVASETTGFMAGFAGYPGTGWVIMDGATAHSKATYAELWTYLTTHAGLVLSSTSTTFTLISASFPFYNGATLTNLQGYMHV